MKKLCIVSHNSRLKENWKKMFSDSFEIVCIERFDEIQHVLNAQDYLILHDDEPLDDLLKKLDSLNAFMMPHRVLVLRTIPTLEEGEQLFAKNIGGYGNANMTEPIVLQAIKVMTGGNIWLYPQLLNHMITKLDHIAAKTHEASLKGLTKREKEVALHIAKGESNQAIAKDLKISKNTVKLHLASIFHKLQIKSRLALALIVRKVSSSE